MRASKRSRDSNSRSTTCAEYPRNTRKGIDFRSTGTLPVARELRTALLAQSIFINGLHAIPDKQTVT
jgi:hypothetical protein